ncbi:MAG: tetratricopeptide repeat protein [Geminicoccaceae bacterium]|nr:tetratricopeptide repeat protein [Geminicoccaceae bacterium]
MGLEDESGGSIPPPTARVLLFADIEGYTVLMGLDERRTIERVRRALDLFAGLIADHGGRVVDFAGDGVFAVFETPKAAALCAIALQQDLARDAVWQVEGRPVRFRIGLHAGEVVEDDDGRVRGLAVNIASRVQSATKGGRICLSERVRRGLLDAGLDLRCRSLGTPPLRNVAQPIELFELVLKGDDPAPTAPAYVPAADLPAPPPRSLDELSVAVLPLRNLSADPANAYVCEGVTHEIIGCLSRFRQLVVIAWHSAYQFRDGRDDPEAAAARLGARYLVQGTLVRLERRVQIQVQLVEAAGGRQIWNESCKADLGELLDVEAEVAGAIASRLAMSVLAEERRRLELRHHPEPDTYGLVLRGYDLIFRYRREPALHAQRLFEQAASRDPRYARVFAGLSRSYNLAWRYRWRDDHEACLDKAVDLANRAIDHDNLDARGFQELGFATLYQKRHDEALAAYEHAHELNPNDADVLAEMADTLCYVDEAERALPLLDRAIRLNPLHPDWYLWNRGDVLFTLGRYEEALATLKRMRDQREAQRMLAAASALLGRMDDARRHAARLREAYPNFSIAAWRKVPPYKDERQVDLLAEGLRLAGLS